MICTICLTMPIDELRLIVIVQNNLGQQFSLPQLWIPLKTAQTRIRSADISILRCRLLEIVTNCGDILTYYILILVLSHAIKRKRFGINQNLLIFDAFFETFNVSGVVGSNSRKSLNPNFKTHFTY